MNMPIINDVNRQKIARRYWLLGAASQNPAYFADLRAFEVDAQFHMTDEVEAAPPTSFEKLHISMRNWLLGAASQNSAYEIALHAFEFAERYHVGTRKDGVTPEYQHQIEIAHAVRNHLPMLMFPVETLALVFLHDVVEDYGVTLATIRAEFGPRIMDAVDRISKVVEGVRKSSNVYYRGLSQCPMGSVAKGFDREQNMDSMIGVFVMVKIGRYTDDVEKYFFKMLKIARMNFPEQEGIYESLKNQLETQVKNARALLAEHAKSLVAADVPPSTPPSMPPPMTSWIVRALRSVFKGPRLSSSL